MRHARDLPVVRIRHPLTDDALARLRNGFPDMLTAGTIEKAGPLPQEANEPILAELPRLRFRFDRQSSGRLRQFVNAVNEGGD